MAVAEDVLGLVGTTIEQVRFDACVDSGGFGLVYRGVHLGMDEPVAVKCLRIAGGRPDPILRETIAARFRDETKLLYRLSQGNLDIVRCIGGGMLTAPRTGEETPYMILEWLEGMTLHADLRARAEANQPPRGLAETLDLLDSAVNALAYAHAQGVIHRDIKPGNLYLARTREGGTRLKVLDFGLAKILDDESLGIRPSAKTHQGVHFCSPSYGAPEQFVSDLGPVGTWTDVYSLALVILEVLVGRRVRSASSLADGLVKSLKPETASPRASSLGLSLPPAVEDLLARAVARQPLERPQDAGVFWSALREVARGAPAVPDTTQRISNLASTVADPNVAAAMANLRAAQARPLAGTMLMANAPRLPAPQPPTQPPPQPQTPRPSSPQRKPAPARAGNTILVFAFIGLALGVFILGAWMAWSRLHGHR